MCYGLPVAALPALPAETSATDSKGELKQQLVDLLCGLNLSEKKHTRPLPHALQAALAWFGEKGYRSVAQMLEATAPFTDVGVSKTSKFDLTSAGQEFELVEVLALKRGPARILLKNLDLQRKGTQP